jgi:fucose 4-O-acetylase-like acetyltransferase
MVVFGHMIEPIIHESSAIKALYLSIYSFHIPAFVLVSGALSKSNITIEQFGKLIRSIVVPFIIFTLLYEAFTLISEGVFSDFTKNLMPYWLLWFLYSLFIWKLLLPIFLSFKYPILFSVVLSVAAGYLDSIGYSLGLSRTLYFFPFFIIGHRLKPKLVAHHKSVNIPIFSLLGILLANLAIFSYFHDMRQEWLYGSYSFARLDNYGLLAGVKRLALYGLSFITAISVLLLIPNKKMGISEKGRNSLHVYVWHGFIVKVLTGAGLIAAIGQLPTASSLTILFAISLALTFILSDNWVAKSTQRFLIAPANELLLNKA